MARAASARVALASRCPAYARQARRRGNWRRRLPSSPQAPPQQPPLPVSCTHRRPPGKAHPCCRLRAAFRPVSGGRLQGRICLEPEQKLHRSGLGVPALPGARHRQMQWRDALRRRANVHISTIGKQEFHAPVLVVVAVIDRPRDSVHEGSVSVRVKEVEGSARLDQHLRGRHVRDHACHMQRWESRPPTTCTDDEAIRVCAASQLGAQPLGADQVSRKNGHRRCCRSVCAGSAGHAGRLASSSPRRSGSGVEFAVVCRRGAAKAWSCPPDTPARST